MAHVLLADNDPNTIDTVRLILSTRGHSLTTADSCRATLLHLRSATPHLVLADVLLPDGSCFGLLHEIRKSHYVAAFVVITAQGSIRSAIEAMRIGALDYLEKPLSTEDILRVVQIASDTPETPHQRHQFPAAAHWARLVVAIIDQGDDVRTLDQWARRLHLSRATLENRCEAAGVRAKPSLDLARMLRVVSCSERLGCRPEVLLDADPRTVRRLRGLSGIPDGPSPVGLCTIDLLSRQSFVTDPFALAALQQELSEKSQHARTHLERSCLHFPPSHLSCSGPRSTTAPVE